MLGLQRGCDRRSSTPTFLILHPAAMAHKGKAPLVCKFYCTAEGQATQTKCVHCDVIYCKSCMHGSKGLMQFKNDAGQYITRCPGCGKNPRVAKAGERPQWDGTEPRLVARPLTAQVIFTI